MLGLHASERRNLLTAAAGGVALTGCVDRALPLDFDDTSSSSTTGDPDTSTSTTTSTTTTTTDVDTSTTDPSTSVGPTTSTTTGVPLDGPPELIHVEFVSVRQVDLFFSEPLGAETGVDPLQFRLSAASSRGGYGYVYTRYTDPGMFERGECYEFCYCQYYGGSYVSFIDDDGGGSTGGCYEVCQMYCPYYGGEPLTFQASSWEAQAPDRLRLTLDRNLAPEICERVRQTETELFLHYSNGGIGQVVDTEGEILRDIAEHWVISESNYAFQEGEFPFLDPRLPIPCPG